MATAALLVNQSTTRAMSGLPSASIGCACNCAVCPSIRLSDGGWTSIDATGIAVTVTEAGVLFPSDVALMMAPPGASAVTLPEALTVATRSLLLDQVMGRSASTFPPASRASAVNWKLSSTTIAVLPGETNTVATGVEVTVICARPLRPPVLAAICTVPTR